MFIELPQTLASTTAEPFPDLDEAFDDPQTFTAARPAGGAQAVSRIRVAAGRGTAPGSARLAVQDAGGFDVTFTQA